MRLGFHVFKLYSVILECTEIPDLECTECTALQIKVPGFKLLDECIQ